MKPKEPPARKKLSMKTRLMVILIVFVLINLIFYIGFDSSEDSSDREEIEQEGVIVEEIEQEGALVEETEEEQIYAKFNPPTP